MTRSADIATWIGDDCTAEWMVRRPEDHARTLPDHGALRLVLRHPLRDLVPAEALKSGDYPGRTLTARATTRIAVTSDTTDSAIMAIFAQVLTGSVSVGLNAVALVNDR